MARRLIDARAQLQIPGLVQALLHMVIWNLSVACLLSLFSEREMWRGKGKGRNVV